MRICFVPFPIVIDPQDVKKEKHLYPYVPLGILSLSTLLEQAGHEVTVLDLVWGTDSNADEKAVFASPEAVARLILGKSPDAVGFSTIFSSYPLVIRWARAFHKLSPSTPIILGGPQATAADEETLKAFPWIKMILRGEAENSIVPLITCLEQGADPADVPGLTWREGKSIIRNPEAPIVTDPDTLPVPAYHLYPMEKLSEYYNNREGLYHHNFPLDAGRGCPFNCSFCSTSSFFQRRYRTKSSDRLIQEMASLNTQYSLRRFDLAHDLFTCNRDFLLEFCHKLREKGLNKTLKWECYSRIDSVDQGILKEMAAAGCSGIFYGVETGSQRMQRIIRKNLAVDQIRPVVESTLAAGINVSISLICGFPQEQRDDLAETVNLAVDMIRMGANHVVLLPLCPLLSSELYREFSHTLHYDGPWSSDILYGCLSQDDQELILKRPQIFAGFYHYETPYLDPDVLRALLRVINRYPHLPAALSAEEIEVTRVFEDWPEWLRKNVNPDSASYYLEQGFFRDFFGFLKEYLGSNDRLSSRLSDLIHYYTVVEEVSHQTEESPIVTMTFNSDIAELIPQLNGRKSAGKHAAPATYLFWKDKGKVISKRLTPALAELLGVGG